MKIAARDRGIFLQNFAKNDEKVAAVTRVNSVQAYYMIKLKRSTEREARDRRRSSRVAAKIRHNGKCGRMQIKIFAIFAKNLDTMPDML